MHPQNFYQCTPYELQLMIEGNEEKKKRDANLLEYTIALGYASAKKGKLLKLFKEERKTKKADRNDFESLKEQFDNK